MNAPFQSDSPLHTSDHPSPGRYAPSVPISVYRELATELKATQAMVDSLTQQNQQLNQQNQVLRQEMLRFVDSATQLKQALEISQPLAPLPKPVETLEEPSEGAYSLTERLSDSMGESVSHLAHQVTQIVRPPAAKPTVSVQATTKTPKVQAKPAPKAAHKRPRPAPGDRMVYTEERLDPTRPGQLEHRSSELSGLWLATTILLIVFSAFGAGFLIMKPLLSNSR